ncbi:MAG: DUF4249 domain-containing protein [Bacteroidales bacterium]|nr:DUF4249 domain-containing protein [Bacteroidales bacterium]
MKRFAYALISCTLLAFSACEKEVEFNAPDTEAASNVTLNAIAVEGEPLTAFLSKAYSVGKAPLLDIGYSFAFTNKDAIQDYQSDAYYKRTGIFDATVQAVVNGQQTYNLTLAEDSMGYVCSYRPQVGDHIEIQAEGLHVKTIVPPSPKIEVLDHKVLAENPYRLMDGMKYETDTIMRITCRILSSGTKQYYRLRVRGERKLMYLRDLPYHAFYAIQDIYFSDDDIFEDKRLSSGFGGWPAYFSNVFDNTLINGTECTFTIDSPKPNHFTIYGFNTKGKDQIIHQQIYEPDVPARVMVELQALSPELYRYLKSVELFRITENDAFSEPVQIYSNVQNGWGILGALSYDRHFVEYGE